MPLSGGTEYENDAIPPLEGDVQTYLLTDTPAAQRAAAPLEGDFRLLPLLSCEGGCGAVVGERADCRCSKTHSAIR